MCGRANRLAKVVVPTNHLNFSTERRTMTATPMHSLVFRPGWPLSGFGVAAHQHVNLRCVTTSSINFQDLSFEDLEALLGTPGSPGDIQLIDVREPSEIAASGKISQAINIPLGQVKAALLMSDEEFQNTYHAVKPQSYDHNIVFYGLGPIKSRAALELAKKAGFTNAREYSGGWEDYCRKKNR